MSEPGGEATTLFDLLERTARNELARQRDDGSMPAGHNGLYHDPETPVRNTSHWLVTFSKLYEETGDQSFEAAARSAASYLQSEKSRPNGATFHHRNIDGKDCCNGLIGQAWTIEALAVASRALDAPELAETAAEVFLAHPQHERTGIWKRVEIDGETLPFDATFNHQVWFAAAGAILSSRPGVSDGVRRRVRIHLDELAENLRLYQSGLVFHPLFSTGSVRRKLDLVAADKRGRIGITFLTSNVPIPSRRKQLRRKAIGYHGFNLYALALLKREFPDHPIWRTTKCERAIEYATSSEFAESVWDNEFGPAYNPVGFEIPFALRTFETGSADDHRWWIKQQLSRHYNGETKRMDRNTEDPNTLTARLYQATRVGDLTLPAFETHES